MILADILGLGHSVSSSGESLALLITFIGVGIVANILVVYALAQAFAERRQNQQRRARYDRRL